MDLPSKNIKKIISYFLSSEAINTHFAVLLAAYVSTVSHVGGMAVTQTLIDLQDNETEFIENFTDIDVGSVSNAVMWSCRDGARGKSFYKGIYLTLFILLIILSVVSFVTNYCRPEFWCKRTVLRWKALIGDSCLAIAILLLFLSFDLSPLSCLAGYGELNYQLQIFHNIVDLVYNVKVVNFHIAMVPVSLVFLVLWFLTNIICFVIDRKNLKCEDVFEDKKYDSDATTEDEDDERHYEIKRVYIRR